MEIHRYERLWFAAALVLIVAFIATVVYGAVGAGVEMIDDDGGTIDPDNWQDHEVYDEGIGVFAANDSDADYEVKMVAQHPAFSPGTVTVPENSTVRFYITSLDVIHGYDVAGTNINSMIIPGQISEFTAEFDETGEYLVVCNEYCGPNHHNMEGSIQVVPESEWNPDDALVGGDA
mgnify:CR=1 FL=1